MSKADVVIKLKNVPVYQKDLLVLSDVDLKISNGEFVYLIGKTGSGKSSLLKVLYADLPVFGGDARVAGFDLRKLKNKEIPYLRRKLGVVFQDFQLLTDRTVNDNLLFAMKATGWKDREAMNEQIENVLIRVGLIAKKLVMPNQLSGGEQQRIAIARALINNPEIILADEPTGNLDPEISAGIIRLLKEISDSGRAVLVATHNYKLIKQFPGRILKCEHHKVKPLEIEIHN